MTLFTTLLASAISAFVITGGTESALSNVSFNQFSYVDASGITHIDDSLVSVDTSNSTNTYKDSSIKFTFFTIVDGVQQTFPFRFYIDYQADYIPYIAWSFGDSNLPNVFISNLTIRYIWGQGSISMLTHHGDINFWYDANVPDYPLNDLVVPSSARNQNFRYTLTFNIGVSYSSIYSRNGSYEEGFESGFQEGQKTSYDVGYLNGQRDFINSSDYTDLLDSQYQTGYQNGKNAGYNEGINTQTYTFAQLFGAIADTPIMILRNLLGFDVFGVDAMAILMSMLTGCIVLYLIKKIIL